ncbi:ClbS/DfsB family four-helix bundle protein [Brucepastera parasyntrophica]|uniref:ClbS/DfsB family four-helix bundle protein n=1 Tax=Brucepastera parasyntrophica TaxID=2880008 RepID=UPI00210DA88D|nr:ClbS/DfsB family four-helix bundle protein [Brucepastera parasyntrophica]ULQ60325.1 ClbS/DfsB family four-helix bundle protein [Brucepastera parasyntrophica]
MPGPATKKELLDLSEKNFSKLLDFINELPDDIKNKTYTHDELNDRDKTVSDVICHLHEWHVMRIAWYKAGISGEKPAVPVLSYSMQTLPVINRRIWEKYQGTDVKKAISLFKESHKDVMALIEKHTDDELFTRKKYPMTGSTTLGAYFYYNTSSHYVWAFKTLKPLKKMVK